MNLNYSQPNPHKLHSPLLDGNNKVQNLNPLKGKRTYYNPNEEKEKYKTIDETLNSTIFNNSLSSTLSSDNKSLDLRFIDSLELFFKIANVFIWSSGGILSLLEFINIARIFSSGTYEFGNSIIAFIIAFISTILASVACIGFAHLIKTTKYVYLNLENQNKKLETLISHLQ